MSVCIVTKYKSVTFYHLRDGSRAFPCRISILQFVLQRIFRINICSASGFDRRPGLRNPNPGVQYGFTEYGCTGYSCRPVVQYDKPISEFGKN